MAKSKALATVNGDQYDDMADLEADLATAVSDASETFMRTAAVLVKMKGRLEVTGRSFSDYMNTRSPLGIKSSHAYRMMLAAEVRMRLPDSPIGESWTEWNMRPLCHSDFTPADHRRLGKKILTRVRRGERLTESLVKEMCDADRGVERKQKVRQEKALADAALDKNLDRAITIVQQLRVGFEMYDEDSWLEVEETNPQLIKSLIRELDDFTSFLRE